MPLAVAITAFATLAAFLTGLTTRLGAHPAWATQTLLIGAALGLIAALVTRDLPFRLRLVAFALFTVATYAIAAYGKYQFAASYAEDVLAGKFWYFGWYATCNFAAATIATLALRRPG
jgi:uncharacterized membrane protein